MASKKRGGLSKRELAAKQTGGSLSYKTGKISVPTKTTAKKPVAPLAGAGPLLPGQSRVENSYGGGSQLVGAGPLLPGQTRVEGSYTGGSSKSSSKSSPKPSSSKPQQIVNKVLGVNTAQASSKPKSISLQPTTQKNTLGNILTGVRSVAAGIVPGASYLKNVGDLGLSELLGLSTRESTGLSNYVDDQGQVLDVQSQGYLNDISSQNGGVIPNNAAELLQQKQTENQARNILRSQGFQAASAFTNSRAPRPVQNQPRPVQNQPQYAFTPSVQSGISAPEVSPQPTYQDLIDTFTTPVQQDNGGTRRQFLGNGYLSNGVASNGKGDYGIEGTMTGTGATDPYQELLNTLLGINTAQAQEMPTVMDFGAKSTPMSAFQSGFNNGGLAYESGPKIQSSSPFVNTQATNQSQLPQSPAPKQARANVGGVAQQYAAPSQNPLVDYQKQAIKGFSAQEKAQKKALNELMKSIKNQYSAQKTQGMEDLNKSKQEDLLKLAGLFSGANQDAQSEQRIQYEQRAQQDYAKQMADFEAKLAAAMTGDLSNARRGYQQDMASIASQRNDAKAKIAQLLWQAQQDALDRSSRRGSSTEPTQPITFAGNDAQGRPVYWNTRTGQYQYAPEGVTRPQGNDWLSALLGSGAMGMGGVQPTY